VINRRGTTLPKVSVIIPTYNRAHCVGRSIKNALDQTYRDIEILIVDDGSTDETFEAVKPFFIYPQVRYLRHKKNKGCQAARNTGIKNARGDYIAFLDSDDTWIPEKIELQLDAINKKGADRVVLTWWKRINGSEQRFFEKQYEGYVYPELLANDGPGFPCMLVPREWLRQIGFLDENISAFTDWDTCISLSKLFEFTTVNKPCWNYYLGEPNAVTKNQLGKAFSYQHIVEKNKNDMLRFAGRRGLARHHLRVAFYFDNAGEFGRCRAHVFRAFRTDYKTPDRFLLAFSTLFGVRVFHFARLNREKLRAWYDQRFIFRNKSSG